MKTLLYLFAGLLLTVSGARAVNADRLFQDYAPEYLEIKVTDVQTVANGGWFSQGKSRIKIQAEVTQVYRSVSGLRPGQRIQIDFDRKNSAGFGDTQPTVPADGAVTPAFLRKEKNIYVPAARQYSFASLTQSQLDKLNPRRNLAVSNTVSPSAAAAVEEPLDQPAAVSNNADIQLRPEEPSPAPAASDDALPSRE